MGGRSKTAVIGSKRRPKRLKIHLDEILIHLDFFCVVRPFFFQNKNQQNHSPPRLENPGIFATVETGEEKVYCLIFILRRGINLHLRL